MLHFLFGRKERKPKKSKKSSSNNSMQSPEPRRPMFAMVCANNVNRSAAAHESQRRGAARLLLRRREAGDVPGKTSSDARTFKFLTPYADMHSILEKEDAALFSGNGVLQILERDMPIKKAPERWQSLSNKQLLDIDVVVCLDYVMFLTVLEGGLADLSWVRRLIIYPCLRSANPRASCACLQTFRCGFD